MRKASALVSQITWSYRLEDLSYGLIYSRKLVDHEFGGLLRIPVFMFSQIFSNKRKSSFKPFQVDLSDLNVPDELPEETKVIYNNLILMGLSPVQEKSLGSFQ